MTPATTFFARPVSARVWPALAAALATGLFAGCLRAADTPDPAPRAGTAAPAALMSQARQALADKQWDRAAGLLRQAVAQAPDDADAHNLLGFASRWQGRMDDAFASYARALALKPDHRGAHEYVGIAYLIAGQPDKAREHLAALERLCPAGCEERSSLAARVAQASAAR